MQNVDWLTFCSAPAIARTVVHFMPLSTTVNAPYLCQVSFTAFGEALGPDPVTVTLDEARVGQADGVRIEDVFPVLRQEPASGGSAGLIGLGISISTNQPRVDLASSGCLIEVHGAPQVMRYYPVRLQDVGLSSEIVWPALRDAYGVTSVVLVNGSTKAKQFTVSQGSPQRGDVQTIEVPARRVFEYVPPGELLAGVAPVEVSWGLLRQTSVQLRPTSSDTSLLAVYIVQREPQYQRISSVAGL